MLNDLKHMIINWWQGELLEESIEEIFKDEAIDKYKYHWSSKIARTVWFFWEKHWHILLPIIVASAVALFIHFDSNNKQKEEHQTSTINHEILQK